MGVLFYQSVAPFQIGLLNNTNRKERRLILGRAGFVLTDTEVSYSVLMILDKWDDKLCI